MHKALGIGVACSVLGLVLQGCGEASTTSHTTTTTIFPEHATYPADKLQFAGRWYDDGNKITGWGQQVTAKFTGSGNVGIYMTVDPTRSTGLYFSYRIDDGDWSKELIPRNPSMLQLAGNLEKDDNHTVTIGRCDEAADGTFTFMDWALDVGYTALAPNVPDAVPLSYQAIGDSITAGYKSECPAENDGGSRCQPGIETTNVYQTYVRHLADHWGTTDWSTVARSGAGLVDNMPSNHAMLDLYKCRDWWADNNCPQVWDFSAATSHPDVITINLGTNDFTLAGPTQEEFKGLYSDFVSFVRSKHPDATIFCINPLEYSFVPATAKYTAMMNGIKDACESFSDSKIIFIATGSFNASPLNPVQDHTSDSTHPTASGHEMFAQFLIPLLTPIVRQNNPHVRLPAPTGFRVLV